MIAKSIFIKRAGCKSGGCVPKAIELTSGDLPFAVVSWLRVEQSILTGRYKSAKGVVAGSAAKARTVPLSVTMVAASIAL
jgi:hypothetical protein